MTLTIKDDGRGVDGSEAQRGFGLLGMRERAMLLGGAVQIESSATGGTVVKATFPKESLI
jgi:signal transduction histidine kinase